MLAASRYAAPCLLLALAAPLAGIAPPASAQTVRPAGASGPFLSSSWARPVGENDVDSDQVDGIGVDGSGNVASAGVFRGVLDLGRGAWQERGKGDIFVASHDAQGRLRWAHHIGSTGADNAFDLDVDGQGAITVSGAFAGRVDFGGVTLTSAGRTDMFIARYDRDGRLLWAVQFGGTGDDGGNEVAVTDAGQIAATGISSGPFRAGASSFAPGGLRDAYVLRLSAAGEVLWTVPANGQGDENLRAVAIAEDGTVFAGYEFQGSLSLPGGTIPGVAGYDGAAIQILSSGAIGWRAPATGLGDDYVRGVAPGPSGSAVVSGWATGEIVVAGTAFGISDPGGDDWLVSLDRNGRAGWHLHLAGPGATLGAEVDTWAGGVLASTTAAGEVVAWQGGREVGRYGTRGARQSMLLAISPAGAVGSAVLSACVPEAGSFGGPIGISPGGRSAAQALRFSGEITVAGATMRTPSEKDSVIVAVGLPS